MEEKLLSGIPVVSARTESNSNKKRLAWIIIAVVALIIVGTFTYIFMKGDSCTEAYCDGGYFYKGSEMRVFPQ
ncbi:MAG: hypothetical protein COZ49_03680 [Candidatus Yonathbacteria bacterium CG_4_10_14_3_um_filter_47_65]|uniref:Uncharacterized protein n=2 Tax=Parcubacteria group TaxID=1794811 RepID=A0A2M8D7R7_9BACT|nr:MAG: hypothetical protein AUJ44_00485 [Candidatus Nomurabacteria bacterium CG1_02_47_685]PIP04250.1 MAG: hypothetical protein COX54_00180 [Candidatus Yonathbacteria bacterium CG23_combo_of_CG06-09_8_20_14_all_46_18]PIQ31951.1 MAG: hypothetical protein COW61_02845 [Candidatus Yonathbacteria bacterium CG17_big_fil_post_rev_8_21_14_2_50_46_19]PIX56159.1 MAG: hypothetical protein COZ49_03680 [Candidatus Yonathbacteria bacterium CG_4_10_14_3_um_filter_47_65]PIY58003.1 MAG: hypothetical protein CO